MSFSTVVLFCPDSSFATFQVFAARDRFKVRWIHARPVSAKMVKIKAGGNGANEYLIHVPMGCIAFPANAKLAIPIAHFAAEPDPATAGCFVNATHYPALK